MDPFLTFVTPTYQRPQALRSCMDSVSKQTAVAAIQHLIFPDYIGHGIAGMYAEVPQWAPAVRGKYVHLLADDDVLASPHVVAEVESHARAVDYPPLILVHALKGTLELPTGDIWPPQLGQIDLGCLIVRSDVWRAHCDKYAHVYEGDFFFADELWKSGIAASILNLRFLIGGVMRGAPEVAA